LKELMTPEPHQPVYGPHPSPVSDTVPVIKEEEEIVFNEEMNLTWDLIHDRANLTNDQ